MSLWSTTYKNAVSEICAFYIVKESEREYTFDQEQKTWQVSGNIFFELKFHDQWCYYPCLLVIVHLITQG